MDRYAVEGLLHKGEKRIFVETEKDEHGYPMGTWRDEIVENNPENTKATFIIDYE